MVKLMDSARSIWATTEWVGVVWSKKIEVVVADVWQSLMMMMMMDGGVCGSMWSGWVFVAMVRDPDGVGRVIDWEATGNRVQDAGAGAGADAAGWVGGGG